MQTPNQVRIVVRSVPSTSIQVCCMRQAVHSTACDVERTLGWVFPRVPNRALTSFTRKVRSAFGWSPKISGVSISGKVLMNSLKVPSCSELFDEVGKRKSAKYTDGKPVHITIVLRAYEYSLRTAPVCAFLSDLGCRSSIRVASGSDVFVI